MMRLFEGSRGSASTVELGQGIVEPGPHLTPELAKAVLEPEGREHKRHDEANTGDVHLLFPSHGKHTTHLHLHTLFAYSSPMGGERGSTTRMRLEGKICCACKNLISPPYTGRETYCTRCRPPQRVVYAAFERKVGWHVVFFDSASKRRLPRELILDQDAKLYQLAKRGRALRELADRQAIDVAIQGGKGGLFLKLTDEQYRRLEGGK
jgi:hypothetical protein